MYKLAPMRRMSRDWSEAVS